jgi:hypothetical protein
LVTPTTLPSFLNGQNPFSYSLIKGKPSGTTKKTVYSFATSTNSFSLATCNAAVPTKPLNWSIQVDPNSVPRYLALMSAPQVTGGQTCSAGSIGSCKKPTQMCFYGDAYTSPSTIALTSSAPSWTVNMCSVWQASLTGSLAIDDGSCTLDSCRVSFNSMNEVPGLITISGPVTDPHLLPSTNGIVSTNTLEVTPQQFINGGFFFRPGTYTFKYNGVNGPIGNGDGYTYYFLNMGLTGPFNSSGGWSCNDTPYCVANGLTGTYPCGNYGAISSWPTNTTEFQLMFTTSTRLYNLYEQGLTPSQKASLAKKWMAQMPVR